MFKRFLLVVSGAAVLVLGYAATKPSDYKVSREVTIYTSAEAIFPFVSESHKIEEWNPFLREDKTAKVTISGPEVGVGAKTAWEDGEKLGTGSATVTEIVPNSLVKTHIEFTQPQAMAQDSEISLAPTGRQTVVRWTVTGKYTFIGKVMCVFFNMDKMVGGAFDQGLASLKKLAESATP